MKKKKLVPSFQRINEVNFLNIQEKFLFADLVRRFVLKREISSLMH
jgi:hypothetical protein